MNRCPVCRMPLEDGLEFCAPTKTMTKAKRNNPSHVKAIFLGCETLDIVHLKSSTAVRSGPQTGRIKHLTDYQRAEKAWGKDCILSEFGPLPTEDEMKGKYVDHSAWERPESYSTRVNAEYQRSLVNGLKHNGVG